MKGRWVWVKSHNAIFGWTSIHHSSAILMFTTLPGWMNRKLLGRPKTPLAVLFTGDEKYEMDACSLWLWVIVQSGTRKRLRWRMEAPYLYIYIYICINRPPTNKNIWNILEITGSTSLYYPCSWAMPYLQAWGLQRHDTPALAVLPKTKRFHCQIWGPTLFWMKTGKLYFEKCIYIYICNNIYTI
jgi:hypothetical protein